MCGVLPGRRTDFQVLHKYSVMPTCYLYPAATSGLVPLSPAEVSFKGDRHG